MGGKDQQGTVSGTGFRRGWGVALLTCLSAFPIACDDDDEDNGTIRPRSPRGRRCSATTRFGDEAFWTDTLRMHEVIAAAVEPDDRAVGRPEGRRGGAAARHPATTVDLNSPATTVALIKLNAVVGIKGDGRRRRRRDTLTRVGITCALCHSTVDDSVHAGHRHAASTAGRTAI